MGYDLTSPLVEGGEGEAGGGGGVPQAERPVSRARQQPAVGGTVDQTPNGVRVTTQCPLVDGGLCSRKHVSTLDAWLYIQVVLGHATDFQITAASGQGPSEPGGLGAAAGQGLGSPGAYHMGRRGPC